MYVEYQLITGKWVDDLLPALQKAGQDGWRVAAYFQEHAVTKILLEKEI